MIGFNTGYRNKSGVINMSGLEFKSGYKYVSG